MRVPVYAMFTLNHFIWLFICFLVGGTAVVCLKKYKPSLRTVLTIACIGCIVSEVIKTFSVLKMVPSTDGSSMHLVLEMQHLPLHLCSIQIIFIFTARFAHNKKMVETLLAFMYPTCTLGALFALALPSIFSSSVDVSQAFTHPLAYQFFLFHTMLVVLGSYIAWSGEVDIRPRHYLSTLGILSGLAFLSLYLNSIFADMTYVNGELVSVDYSPNFFFTQDTPIGIELYEKWQWYLYICIIVALAVVLIGLFYLPFFIKTKKIKDPKNKISAAAKGGNGK